MVALLPIMVYFMSKTAFQGGISLKKYISAVLVAVLTVTMMLTGCGKQSTATSTPTTSVPLMSETGDPALGERTVSVLSTAIRTLSDSAFTDYDLLKAIYANAFTNRFGADAFLTKDLSELLSVLTTAEADELLVNATVAYGGTAFSGTAIGELKPSIELKQSALFVGDVLLIGKGGTYAYYIYDKDRLVNLSAPLETVNTAAVLSSLPASERFAVIRIVRNMTKNDFVDKLPEQHLTEAQQAIVATAQSYLLRGDKLQYVSMASGLDSSHFIGERSPEDYTSDNYGPIQCSGFCYTVYRQALDMTLECDGKKLITSDLMRKYAASLNIQAYLMKCGKEASYTEEDRTRIAGEILALLEPGDILLVDRASGGHVMLYVGNGDIIHADGTSYNMGKYTETYEATIRQMRFKEYFLTEGGNGYLFASDTGKKVKEFLVLRPLDIFSGEIPEATKNRIKNLQGVMAQKLSSHNLSLTADVGEEITYTFEMYNQNDHEVTLAVSDVVPAGSVYVSGADAVDGDALSWQVTIPANTRKTVSYVVKVSETAKAGDTIVSESGLIGGVPVNCPAVTVGNTLSAEELAALKEAINGYTPSEGANGFDMVNDIYKQTFGWTSVFKETDFDKVYDGKNGIFNQVQTFEHYWTELRPNTRYASMIPPNLVGGFGTKEGRQGKPVVMPVKERQLVVGDVLVCKFFGEPCLYLYAGDGVFYDLLNGYTADKRTAQGRLEYVLCTDFGYAVLRPSLVY